MSTWNILVGFDGSEHAKDALDFGERLAAAIDARLILACVYPFRPLTGRLGSGDQARAVLAGTRLRRLRRCEHRIIPGTSAAEGLRRLADSDDVHIIVLGSRHRGRLSEALPGRTARALIAAGTHLVAIVPRGHRAMPVRRVGVLTDGSAVGRAALLAGRALAREAAAELRVHGEPTPEGAAAAAQAELADDLAQGSLDLLVAPAWPYGLLGRLRRRGRLPRTLQPAGCPVVIVPAGARLPATADTRDAQRPGVLRAG